jgi:NOL1/NOP2/sun family putative RNA methylase
MRESNAVFESEGQRILERYREIVPGDFNDFLATAAAKLPRAALVNTLAIAPDALIELLAEQGIKAMRLKWNEDAFRVSHDIKLGSLIEYGAGLFNIQEEVSMLPVAVLGPRPYERILDLCAAPGSKTMQAAVMMRNRGTILANDVNRGRLSALRMNMARLGILNVSTSFGDGLRLKAEYDSFDGVICDVPCSGEGTLRKSSGALAHGLAHGQSYRGGIQLSLLRKAIKFCKPGGRIVYSTCSLRPEENEMIIDKVLAEQTVRMVPVQLSGFVSAPGLHLFDGQPLNPDLKHAMRVWPHQNNTGGFFVALLQKVAK